MHNSTVHAHPMWQGCSTFDWASSSSGRLRATAWREMGSPVCRCQWPLAGRVTPQHSGTACPGLCGSLRRCKSRKQTLAACPYGPTTKRSASAAWAERGGQAGAQLTSRGCAGHGTPGSASLQGLVVPSICAGPRRVRDPRPAAGAVQPYALTGNRMGLTMQCGLFVLQGSGPTEHAQQT